MSPTTLYAISLVLVLAAIGAFLLSQRGLERDARTRSITVVEIAFALGLVLWAAVVMSWAHDASNSHPSSTFEFRDTVCTATGDVQSAYYSNSGGYANLTVICPALRITPETFIIRAAPIGLSPVGVRLNGIPLSNHSVLYRYVFSTTRETEKSPPLNGLVVDFTITDPKTKEHLYAPVISVNLKERITLSALLELVAPWLTAIGALLTAIALLYGNLHAKHAVG